MRRALAARLFAAFAVMLFVSSASAQEKAAEVAGAWDMVQQGRNGPLHQTLTANRDGLEGVYQRPERRDSDHGQHLR